MTYWALELGTGFSMEMRMATKNVFRHWIRYGDKNAHQEYMKYRALDSIWRYECSPRISDTRFGHWIQYGDMNAHSEYQMLDLDTGFSMEI